MATDVDPFHVSRRAFWIAIGFNGVGLAVNAYATVYYLWRQNFSIAGFQAISLGLCALFLFTAVQIDRRLAARMAIYKLKHDKLLLDNEAAKAFVGFAEAQKAIAEHMLWSAADDSNRH